MAQVLSGLEAFEIANFSVHTLVVKSHALEGNPLGDSTTRRNPVLVPRKTAPAGGWPLVLVLSGFTGNGPNAFNVKTFEENLPQTLDKCRAKGEAPDAVYVLCDAMTSWGGSQFINSEGMGLYEDFVLEVVDAAAGAFPVSREKSRNCVTGGSSGGYGALHLGSAHPDRFGLVAAIAPDSFFEASLWPEILGAWPAIEKMGGVAAAKAELEAGKLMRRKDAHHILNVIAMGLCYAPDGKGSVRLPIDRETGLLENATWASWRKHDPVVFLKERAENVRKLEGIFLDVGTRDQFHLQYGTRQIKKVLDGIGARASLTEFDGTHFDIGERRPEVWKWLKERWA